jgi:uncharacterized protein (TIGR04141 family)
VSEHPGHGELPEDTAAAFGQATIYLAEDGVDEFDDLIRTHAEGEPPFRRVELSDNQGLDGVAYITDYQGTDPGWKRTLAALLADPLEEVSTRQAGAVLLLRLAGRVFVFSFGQGRHLLNRERLVDDFGVRVAANTVDPRQIRSVDGRSFDRGVILTRRQASRPDRIEALGLQVDRELFGSITGRSRRPGEGRVHGGTSLGLTRAMPFAELDALGAQLLADYEAQDYRDAFRTLDRMRPIARTDRIVPMLVEALVRDLRSPEPSAYLAPPTLLDWESVSGFRLSSLRGQTLVEPDLDVYLDSKASPITAEELLSDRVAVIDRDSPRVLQRLPLMRWLVFETTVGEDSFVLSDGRWFRVSTDYIASVDASVALIAPPALVPPSPTRPSMHEDEYNAEAARALGGVLLDKELARVGTERGGFELCDVFVPPNQLLHVKRGLGSQALTYLFSQGEQAAEGLRVAREVRERLADLVGAVDPGAAAALPKERRPTRDELTILYVVVTGSPGRVPGTLPFFARARLARAARTLSENDFGVSIVGVAEA